MAVPVSLPDSSRLLTDGDHAGGCVDGHLDAVLVGRGHRLGAGVDAPTRWRPGRCRFLRPRAPSLRRRW